jgi:Ca2+-binding RTX toxin-like protein
MGGNDTIYGNFGSAPDPGADTIFGGAGNDSILFSGLDSVYGGSGNDTVNIEAN